MKKILDLTDCTSTEQMCDKIEKELNRTNKTKKNKTNNNQKPAAQVTKQPTEKVETIKLTLWQKIKRWFKRVF